MFCRENHFLSTSSFSAEKLVQNLSPKDAAQDRLSILHSLQGDNLEDKDISAALREKLGKLKDNEFHVQQVFNSQEVVSTHN